MKNITVSVDDKVYHAARVKAAEMHTSVSALVRHYLEALRRGHAPVPTPAAEDDDRGQREELVAALKKCNLVLGYKPTRDKTYER